MAFPSPILDDLRSRRALLSPWGEPVGGVSIEIAEAMQPVEIEYAALRRRAAIIDRPERAVIEVRGGDRLDFLNRMITQELLGGKAKQASTVAQSGRKLDPYTALRSFWLNRKGRIDADLRIIALENRLLFDLDVHAAARLLNGGASSDAGEPKQSGLPSFVFAEDISFEDITARTHRLSLHGPGAAATLSSVTTKSAGAALDQIQPGEVAVLRRESAGSAVGREIVVDRHDTTGEIGLEIACEAGEARLLWLALVEAGATPAGWHAFNIARIEAGTALYMLDFGPNSLPHETGEAVLHDRVSFSKGCYLGQEVVARMQSRGHSKAMLVGLRFDDAMRNADTGAGTTNPFLRERGEVQTGASVVDADSPAARTIGTVTSAATSPMLGAATIAFAMVKPSHAAAGARVFVQTDSARLAATVQRSLVFWKH